MPPRIEPILIDSADRVKEIKEEAHREKRDELLGCAEVASLALSEGLFLLPIRASFPDPPDIVLCSTQSKLAVEVSRVT